MTNPNNLKVGDYVLFKLDNRKAILKVNHLGSHLCLCDVMYSFNGFEKSRGSAFTYNYITYIPNYFHFFKFIV